MPEPGNLVSQSNVESALAVITMSLPPLSKPVSLTSTGLHIQGQIPFSEWSDLALDMAGKAGVVDGVSRAWKLGMGDVLAYGEERYGEECHQVLDEVYRLIDPEGKGRQHAYNIAWVSRQIPEPLRDNALSWSHLREAAAIPASERKKWLGIAEKDHLSTRDFRKAVEPLKNVTKRNRPEKTVEHVSVDVEPEEVDCPTHVPVYIPNEAWSHLCALAAQDNEDRGLEQSPKEYLLFLIERLYHALSVEHGGNVFPLPDPIPITADMFCTKCLGAQFATNQYRLCHCPLPTEEHQPSCTGCGGPRDIPLARGGYLSRCTTCRNKARRK